MRYYALAAIASLLTVGYASAQPTPSTPAPARSAAPGPVQSNPAPAPAAPAATSTPPPAPPAPAAAQPAPGYGPPLGLEPARKVLAAAEAEAKRLNLYATIVVVEPSGDVVLAQKMDNAQFGGFENARRKARAAALSRRPPGVGGSPTVPSPGAALARPAIGANPGGELIITGGRIIGAVGVSAGVLQEEQVAKAGAAAIR